MTVRKVAPRPVAHKAVVKKTVVRKPVARKTPVRKPVAKKAPARKPAAKKPLAKPAGKKAKVDTGKQDDALAAYGWSRAMINSDPELKSIFTAAVKNNWAPAKFVARVQNTKWFTTHSASWRTSEALRLTDPASYREQKITMVAGVGDIAGEMGANVSGALRNQIAEQAIRMGWDEHQIRNAMAQYVSVVSSGDLSGQYLGNAGDMQRALTSMAKRNAYTLNDSSLNTWVKSVASGEASMEDYQQFIRRQTAATYSAFADEIMAGADLADVASPYTNAYAQLLEVPGEDVELLKDPTIQRALNYRDPKTGKVGAQTIYEFQDNLRKDARWQYTDNAHQQALGLGSRVLQTMGLGGYS